MLGFDVGIALPSTSRLGWPDQCRLARCAEDAGYSMVLLPESWGADAFTRLGAIATQTDTVELGPGIVPVHSRSPTLLAQSAATLDLLTGGRAVLGLGLSSPVVIESWHGVPFEPALRRQRETIEVIKLALTGDPVIYAGQVFDLDRFRLRFPPLRNDVPVYVAAQGPTNCELVGGFADGWFPNRIPVSALPNARRAVDRGATAQGREPAGVLTMPFVTTCVLDDGDHARWRCREMIGFYLGAMGDYHFEAVARHGYRDTAETIRTQWEDGERDAAREAVTADLLDEIAIAGTPDHAERVLDRYQGIADTVITLPPTTASPGEMAETIGHLSPLIG